MYKCASRCLLHIHITVSWFFHFHNNLITSKRSLSVHIFDDPCYILPKLNICLYSLQSELRHKQNTRTSVQNLNFKYVHVCLCVREGMIGVKVQILARESFCFDGQTSSAVDHKTYNTFVK